MIRIETRITTRKDSRGSKTNHQFKNIFLKNKPLPKTNDELKNYLDEFEIYTNTEWIPGEFYGLTPFEVLHGEIPDKHRFTKNIQLAQQQRIIDNRNVGLEICKECIGITNHVKNNSSKLLTHSLYYN